MKHCFTPHLATSEKEWCRYCCLCRSLSRHKTTRQWHELLIIISSTTTTTTHYPTLHTRARTPPYSCVWLACRPNGHHTLADCGDNQHHDNYTPMRIVTFFSICGYRYILYVEHTGIMSDYLADSLWTMPLLLALYMIRVMILSCYRRYCFSPGWTRGTPASTGGSVGTACWNLTTWGSKHTGEQRDSAGVAAVQYITPGYQHTRMVSPV